VARDSHEPSEDTWVDMGLFESWQDALAMDPSQLLHEATMSGDVEAMENAIKEGADLLARNESGGTALHTAARNGHHRALGALLKHTNSRNREKLLQAADANGNTALHLSAQGGHSLATRHLLEAGASLDLKNSSQQTALDLAEPHQQLRGAMEQRGLQGGARRKPGIQLQAGVFAGGSYHPSTLARGQRRRVALVIGNDRYSHMPALPNCVNDAKDVAIALRSRDFQCMVITDQTRPQMLACIRAFRQGLKKDDVVLLYFSGHGVECDGVPYMVPIEVELRDDIEQEAVSLNWIMKTLNSVSGKTTNLIFLDACRFTEANSTFKGGEVGLSMRGFRAPSEAEYCIALSSDPGTASHTNPEGRNSVFTQHLLKCLNDEEICTEDVEIMLRHVRSNVMDQTAQKQRPWTQSCLSPDGFKFCMSTS